MGEHATVIAVRACWGAEWRARQNMACCWCGSLAINAPGMLASCIGGMPMSSSPVLSDGCPLGTLLAGPPLPAVPVELLVGPFFTIGWWLLQQGVHGGRPGGFQWCPHGHDVADEDGYARSHGAQKACRLLMQCNRPRSKRTLSRHTSLVAVDCI